MKKIALIGNMNNNFFSLCRHLRDRGYEAELFFRPAVGHFHPKADTTLLRDLAFCHEVDWFNNGLRGNALKEKVYDDLKEFDFFIGTGDEAAVAYSAGINFDIYCPYGSDIYKYAHLPHNFPWHVKLRSLLDFRSVPSWDEIKDGTRSKHLFNTIRSAKNIIWDHANPEIDAMLYRIRPQGLVHRLPVPFLYVGYLDDSSKRDFHWASEIEILRNENNFLVLYHGRQEWKNSLKYKNNKFTTKNTHHLILGFSNFVKETSVGGVKLIMLEYGGDVLNSKKLIRELGIENHVVWLPTMYRKDIFFLIQHVDLCCGEFDKSYVSFGTIMESMILGKPVIHYRDDALYADKYEWLYPLYNCKYPEEIMGALLRAYEHPEERKEIGRQAKEWVGEYLINRPLSLVESLIMED